MQKWIKYLMLVGMCANSSWCMDGDWFRDDDAARQPESKRCRHDEMYDDVHFDPVFEGLVGLYDPRSGQEITHPSLASFAQSDYPFAQQDKAEVWQPVAPQQWYVVHRDDMHNQCQVFCDTNRSDVAYDFLFYHVLDATCPRAELLRSLVRSLFPPEFTTLIQKGEHLFSLACSHDMCTTVAQSHTVEKLQLRMVMHRALRHNQHPRFLESIRKMLSRKTRSSVIGAIPEAPFYILDLLGRNTRGQYSLFFGDSPIEVMQKYLENKLQRGVYNLSLIKAELVEQTAAQCKVQKKAHLKSLICPTRGCEFKVKKEGAESFDPLFEELLKHYVVCMICHTPNHECHKQATKLIGTSFDEARCNLEREQAP